MSRIDDTFVRLRAEGRTGLVTYVTAGDPNLTQTAEILLTLDRYGADLIEVGVPFSDPLAGHGTGAGRRHDARGRPGDARGCSTAHPSADRHLQLRQSDTPDGPGRVRPESP